MKKIKRILFGFILMVFGINSYGAESLKSLSKKEKNIVVISAFTAKGDIEKLKNALNSGLDNGVTVNEIKSLMVQLYAYCGFPRSLNGTTALIEVLKERSAKGINDEVGKIATILPKNVNIYNLGTQVQTKLVGAPVQGELYAFSPEIDKYLKTHLFGDIFSNDILDYKTRELITVGALSTMEGVNSQLQGHINMSRNAGVSDDELKEIEQILKENFGRKAAKNYKKILTTVLNN